MPVEGSRKHFSPNSKKYVDEELVINEKINVKHYIILDDYFTWWDCGRSYLCRIIDLLHMGYVDKALFGYEVVEQMPRIVKEWVALHKKRARSTIIEPKIA